MGECLGSICHLNRKFTGTNVYLSSIKMGQMAGNIGVTLIYQNQVYGNKLAQLCEDALFLQ